MMYLVDDAADYQFLVKQVFKLFLPQYPLQLFSDGLDFVQYVKQKSLLQSVESSVLDQTSPDLVVLDVDMPKLNGFQTLEWLKQEPYWQAVPVVIMSNRTEPDFEAIAYQLGANVYINKPMDLIGIRDTMEHLCHQWLDTSPNVRS